MAIKYDEEEDTEIDGIINSHLINILTIVNDFPHFCHEHLHEEQHEEEDEEQSQPEVASHQQLTLKGQSESIEIEVFHFVCVLKLNNSSRLICVSVSPALRSAMTALPCRVGSA